MSSANTQIERPGRTSAVLTTGEVAATSLDVGDMWGGQVNVEFDFTIGSLTNVVLRFYVSHDGTTWRPFRDEAGNVSYTLTASTSGAYSFNAPGWRYFRFSCQGTGTVTDSLAAGKYRGLKRGSQG